MTNEVVSSNLPVLATPLTSSQMDLVKKKLQEVNFVSLKPQAIVALGGDAEKNLHKTLDGFLSQIGKVENPMLFKLTSKLSEEVTRENLPKLAERILNDKPGLLDKAWGMLSKKHVKESLSSAWEETKTLVQGKTKNLLSLINVMENDLTIAQKTLCDEIQNMERLKESYQDRFSDFVVETAFVKIFLEKAKDEVKQIATSSDQNDMVAQSNNAELANKLQVLESRALSLEGALTRLPADQLVIRQIQDAGIATLQETSITACERFASIKMTLLTIHGALTTANVQKLSQEGKDLDNNLQGVRSMLMKSVVTSAANAPGDNRLAQAENLRLIIEDVKELDRISKEAQGENSKKFERARQVFGDARKEMLSMGQQGSTINQKQLN